MKGLRVTSKLVADLDPAVKEKLDKIKKKTGVPITRLVTNMIMREYDKHFGKES